MNEKLDNIMELPALIINDKIVYPGVLTHLDISDKKSYETFKKAMSTDKKVFIGVEKKESSNKVGIEGIHSYGTVASIKQAAKNGVNTFRILLEGEHRAKVIGKGENIDDILRLEVIKESDELVDNVSRDFDIQLSLIRENFMTLAALAPGIPPEIIKKIELSDSLYREIWRIVGLLKLTLDKALELFENEDISDMLFSLSVIISDEIERTVLINEYRNKVKEKVNKHQKEYILREQMKYIQEELGEDDSDDTISGLKKKVDALDADVEVKEKMKKEVNKLSRMSPQSSEANVIQNYLDVLFEIPWNNTSSDNKDYVSAEKIMQESHYGLEKVKERIIEFLAVRIFSQGRCKSPVICLVGPPGTGKTSIAKFVAEAMGKKYERICLGGMSDEAEIRGHRRTYIGAKPGRIIDAITRAGYKNPLILLDEIDKLGSDYKGNPAAALLEVLDTEQNSRFVDRYVELPVDLSGVFFMATANDISGIPGPLKDRMEIIEVNSYTSVEKRHIAMDFLIEKQRVENGLKKNSISFSKKAIDSIISKYTRESGVRQLDRLIAKVCRKSVIRLMTGEEDKIKISDKNLEEFLGKPKYKEEKKEKKPMVGIVRGLAWTSVGGDTLEIEVLTVPGEGKVKMTGKLGDVMKESAEIALSYVKKIAAEYGIEKEYFKENDFHIHVPEGAVPKDGPSAGVTMTTALLSAVTGLPVYTDVAMTGEMTLRGKVLPIGGLKEKILAAKKFGIKKVIVPDGNRADVEEISEEIKEGIELVYAIGIDDVIGNAIEKNEQS